MLKRFLLWLWDDGKGSPGIQKDRRTRFRIERDECLEDIARLHGVRANLYKKIAEEIGALKADGHLGGMDIPKNVDFVDIVAGILKDKELALNPMLQKAVLGFLYKKKEPINKIAGEKFEQILAKMSQNVLSESEAEKMK